MVGIPAVLVERQVHNCWFRGFGHHFTDRRVGMPDIFRHLIGVFSISVLSNSHSGIDPNHCPYKLSECKQHAQNKRLLSHLCTGDLYWNIQLQRTDRATHGTSRNFSCLSLSYEQNYKSSAIMN